MYRTFVKKSLPRDELKHVSRHAPDGLKYCNFLCQDYKLRDTFTTSETTVCNNCVNIMNLAKKHIKENKYTKEEFVENPNLACEEDETPVVLTTKKCTNCKQEKYITEYDINKNYCKSCRLIQSQTRNGDISTELKDIESLKTNFVELERFLRKIAKDKLTKIVSHHSIGRLATDSKDKIVLNIVLHFQKLSNPYICRGGCSYILSEPLSTCDGCKKTKARTKITITEFKESVLPDLLKTLDCIKPTDDHLYNGQEVYAIAVGLGLKPSQRMVKAKVVELINKKLEDNREEKKKLDENIMKPILEKEYKLELNGIIILSRENDGYVNATQLCKAGGKEFKHWNSLESTKELVVELYKSLGHEDEILKDGYQTFKLIESEKGRYGGSWIHPDLAVQLAQWISPKFAIQVSRWVRELSISGSVCIGKEKSNEQLLQLQQKIIEKDTKIKALENKHDKLLKKRNYHKFLQGPALYLISNMDCSFETYKIGIDTEDVNVRLQQHRTSIPGCKVEFLLYSPKCKLIEDTILQRYEDQRDYMNHEWIYGMSKESIIDSIKTFCDFAKIPYNIDDTIDKYNEQLKIDGDEE